MSKDKYLNMQRSQYQSEASTWSLENRDPVVGNYVHHEASHYYDDFLFKNFNTEDLIAIEYGCGPGRNLIRFANRFKRVDGVDISSINKEKAILNLKDAGIDIPNIYVNNGDNIPVDDSTYDVVFSTICLQHICVHEIRFNIMKEAYRVLKPGGHFCAQMGFGDTGPSCARYYDNNYDAPNTNGGSDTCVEDEQFLIDDLTKIGFKNYKSDKTLPIKDGHKEWIWFQVEK